MKTYFAPAERAEKRTLEKQIAHFANVEYYKSYGDSLPVIFLILNENRQIVYGNQRLLEALNVRKADSILGKRVGEALNCIHANREGSGCGTTRFCENCGAVNAILESQTGVQSVKECRLNLDDSGAADYRVWATPHEENGEQFTFFTVQDIQHEKRRQALEHTFFHDLLNTAGGILSITDLMEMIDDPDEQAELLARLKKYTQQLVEEIRSGRTLILAENDELKPHPKNFDLNELLSDCMENYSNHLVAKDKQIKLELPETALHIHSDPVILGRVISNLLKNALEASLPKGVVTVKAYENKGGLTISVHNATAIPAKTKAQIFQRSFSTKGTGRGIGTYSVRLYTEKYLQGRADFDSEIERGTTFYVHLNKEIK